MPSMACAPSADGRARQDARAGPLPPREDIRCRRRRRSPVRPATIRSRAPRLPPRPHVLLRRAAPPTGRACARYDVEERRAEPSGWASTAGDEIVEPVGRRPSPSRRCPRAAPRSRRSRTTPDVSSPRAAEAAPALGAARSLRHRSAGRWLAARAYPRRRHVREGSSGARTPRPPPLAAAALGLVGDGATRGDSSERFATTERTIGTGLAGELLERAGRLGLVRVARHDGDRARARAHEPRPDDAGAGIGATPASRRSSPSSSTCGPTSCPRSPTSCGRR